MWNLEKCLLSRDAAVSTRKREVLNNSAFCVFDARGKGARESGRGGVYEPRQLIGGTEVMYSPNKSLG